MHSVGVQIAHMHNIHAVVYETESPQACENGFASSRKCHSVRVRVCCTSTPRRTYGRKNIDMQVTSGKEEGIPGKKYTHECLRESSRTQRDAADAVSNFAITSGTTTHRVDGETSTYRCQGAEQSWENRQESCQRFRDPESRESRQLRVHTTTLSPWRRCCGIQSERPRRQSPCVWETCRRCLCYRYVSTSLALCICRC
jgi:hypothetical protein